MAEYRQRCSCGCGPDAGCPCRYCGGTGTVTGNGSAKDSRGQIKARSLWDKDRGRMVAVRTTAAGGPAA